MNDKKGSAFVPIILIILLILLGIAAYLFYSLSTDLNASPIPFKLNKTSENISSYPAGDLQSYPNLRFFKNTLNYKIYSECTDKQRENMEKAFSYLMDRTNNAIIFSPTSANEEITIRCGKEFVPTNIPFTDEEAGVGGPTNITNTSLFSLATNGEIVLILDSCKFNVELHELLHVLGFKHSDNKDSLMYPISSCDQVLSEDIIDEIKRLYKIESLPDLYFTDASAIKTGRYINFNVSIMNQGLADSGEFDLELYAGDTPQTFNLKNAEAGTGKVFSAWNIKIPSGTTTISFEIKNGRELSLTNNRITLSI